MIYLIRNPFTQEAFETIDINEARAKMDEYKAYALAVNANRFTVIKEVAHGNDTTWVNADLDNDPENNNYHVFNTFTDQHELVTSLSLAKARHLEIKQQFDLFITSLGLDGEPQVKPAQPIAIGVQDL